MKVPPESGSERGEKKERKEERVDAYYDMSVNMIIIVSMNSGFTYYHDFSWGHRWK